MAPFSHFLFIFVSANFILSVTFAQEEGCVDIDGRDVEHGLLFVPGPNVCTQCVCHHSEPKWCQTMFCNGPPYGCKNYKVGKTCCQFECLDPPTEKPMIDLRELVAKNSAHQTHHLTLPLKSQEYGVNDCLEDVECWEKLGKLKVAYLSNSLLCLKYFDQRHPLDNS